MSADAVVLFRPKDPEKLKPFLDLDDESEESDGLYAEALDDGAMLVHTFQPFEVFEDNPSEAREWLAQFGDVLADVHDDDRGILFFPDSHEAEARTYDAVVAEVGDDGIWIATSLVDEDDDEPPIDMNALQAFAGQVLGRDPASGAVTSFEVGKMFQDMQQELTRALGLEDALQPRERGEPIDEEFAREREEDEKPKK
jgi:hypothetical protein